LRSGRRLRRDHSRQDRRTAKTEAQLNITETEAKDIALGQPVSIDTRNGMIPGKVSRINPTP